MRAALLFAALTLSCSAAAQTDGVYIKSGFITGSQFRAFAMPEKQKYVMGLLDGTFLSPLFGVEKGQMEWLERCATGMDGMQAVAVVEKYLRDSPARWHESMNVLTFSAFKQACAN